MLPLDLHVLSLSLAFILSQDQTLRCSNCFMSLLKIPLFFQVQVFLTVFILNTCTTVVYVNFSKNSFQSFLAKRGAKVRIFIFIFQIFSKVFFRFIFSEVLSERLQDIRLDLPTSSLGISISGFLSPLSSCHHRISLDCGCKSTAVKHIIQMFFQLFCNYFLLSLIVNDLQMHFSPLFYFPLPFLFLLSKFSIFKSPFSILKKPACFYHFAPAFQQKTPAFFPFYTYLSKSNKRESISILAGFTFDSRLVWNR